MKKFLFLCYSKCSTCKKAERWLTDNGVNIEMRDIKTANPTAEELLAWHKLSGLPLKKFFNTSGASYKDMGLKDKLPDMSEDEQIKLLATDGMLVKRPILVGYNRVLVGFKEVEWAEKLLGETLGKKTIDKGCVPAFVMKITLKGVRPSVWRRVVVPQNMTFQKLGEIFIIAMGWSGYHMSVFEMPKTGVQIVMGAGAFGARLGLDAGDLMAKKVKLSQFLPREAKFSFIYDMGDYWEHKILIEKVIDDYEFNYPQVTAYKGNCPPEDCGGSWGYEEMLENPDDYDEEDMPTEYDLAEVNKELKRIRARG